MGDNFITFGVDEVTADKINKWQMEHQCRIDEHQGAIGGRYTYSFTPTGLGVIVKVKCACGEEVDLTDYESW